MSVASVGSIPISPIPSSDLYRSQTVRQEPAPKSQSSQREPIHSTAADLQQIGLVFNKKLQFVVDHNSNQVIVKVIDKETDKVIKELPPEELQRLHNSLKETIGLLFDERV